MLTMTCYDPRIVERFSSLRRSACREVVFPTIEEIMQAGTIRDLLGLVLGLTVVFESGVLMASEPSNYKSITFCNGMNGYQGTVDVEIWAIAPTTILNSNPQVSVDENNGGAESQVLMRFDGIFGDGENQIPLGASITSARLEVGAFDQGDTVHLHRMLVPFGKAPTWNKMISGVSADDLESLRVTETFTFGKISAASSAVHFEVTETLQAWSNGAKNHGWVFISTGGNGWDFYASDFDKVAQRPRLIVNYAPPSKHGAKKEKVGTGKATGK